MRRPDRHQSAHQLRQAIKEKQPRLNSVRPRHLQPSRQVTQSPRILRTSEERYRSLRVRVPVDRELDSLISSLEETEMSAFKEAMKHTWSESGSIRLRRKFSADTGDFPEAKFGLLVSGSSVIAHDVKGDEIIDRFPSALGLEMETFAIYKAASLAVGVRPVVLSIKGVADFGDGSKHKKFQSLASRLSYDIGREIITKYFENTATM